MRKVAKLVAAQLRRVYFRLARPLVNRMREERAHEYRQMQEELAKVCDAVGAEATRMARARQELLGQVRAELERMNQGLVEYHAVLTQKVADELTKMKRRLEPPARAA